MALAAVTTIVAALAAVLLVRAGGTSPTWQTYHDPSGLFTLWLPPGWTAQIETSTAGYGDSSGSATVSEEMVTFDDPVQGTGSAHFWIVADPIKTAFERQYNCQDSSMLQSFSARNLSTMEQTGAVWFFTTETAYFQVDVAIPGVLAPATFGHPLPTAAPIPATWLAADKADVNAILVSFQPTDSKPLVC
jgi:hypothetical protein